MKNKSVISLLIIFSIIIQSVTGLFTASASDAETEYVSIGTTNDAGDYCYFNNHYCYTSINPNYNNFNPMPKNNYIECYRLDYTNPKRKDYIYLEKTDTETDCYFDINCNRLSYTKYQARYYDYYLVQGDFKVGLPGADVQMFLFRDKLSGTSNIDYLSATLRADGSIRLYNGTVIPDVAKINTWFNMKVAMNLKDSVCDVYINGEKKAAMPIKADMKFVNMVRMNLYAGIGNMYADNFSVTGLEVPYENGVEVKSDVFPDNPVLKEFMKDKIGLHGYGKLIYKDGIKSHISPEPVYDADKDELYVHPDTVNSLLDLSLAEKGGVISGNGITVDAGGNVAYNGASHKMKNGILTVTDSMYVPITEFAKIMGKYVFSYDNGVILISDKNETLDTSEWDYITFRPDQSAITLFKDMDFLNNMLSYEQPDNTRLKEDFARISGDYVTAHPRILLNKSGFDRLRELYKTDKTYKSLADTVISKADSYAKAAPQTYVFDDAMRMYATGARTQNYFMYWGYAYKMTGDKRYVKRAVKELEALDKFPDFNPMHIIDTGMFCMGLACAYDWFYDAYTPEELELARRVVFEKCYKSLSDAYYGRLSQATSGNGAIKWTSNYNAVVSGGCLNAAIATIECDPEYNIDMINNCIRSLEYTLAGIMPGGGWSESVSYWNYTMEFLSYSMASLNTAFGTDYGLSRSQGMEDTLKYAMACLGIGGMYNFHDSGQSTASLTNSYKCFMYLANTYGIEDAYGMRMYDLIKKRTSPVPEDVLFYNGAIEDFDSIYDKNGTDIKIDGTELFSVRDTYNRDKSKFYFATHFGATWGYHHHCDCGSFVLDINGTRFADDLGADDYNIENELKYSSYQLYRKRGEGHNIMIFDRLAHTGGFEQKLNMFAPITSCESDGNISYVVADMSEVYAESRKVSQGYYIDKDKMSVTMRNEFEVNPGTEVYWFMHTRADIQIEGNRAYLTRDGHTVCVSFDTNAPVGEIMKMKAEPMPESPQVPEQNPNEVFSKVAIRLEAGKSNYLTVNICPMENAADELISQPLATWSLNMNGEEKIQTVAEMDSFADFSYPYGSEAKGVFGAERDDSSLYVPVGESTVQIASHTFEPKNRYTVASFNLAPYRAVPEISDKFGNNLLVGLTLDGERWNHICAIYDSDSGKAMLAVNGSYGKWQDTDYEGGSAVFTLRGNTENSGAYADNYRLYTSSAVPDVGYIYAGGGKIDGNYILSDGSLRAEDLISNGSIRVYTDSTMQTLCNAGDVLGEGAVAVFENNGIYIYLTVTLQPEVTLPVKYYGMVDEFSSANCVRNTLTTVPDITGTSGSCAYIRGTEESDTNHYMNYNLSMDDTVKVVSVDVYPTDSVSKIKFATNGHVSLSAVIQTSSLVPGKWNNLKLIIDPVTDINTLYVNGVKHSTLTYEMKDNLRLVMYTDKMILSESEIYLDNVVIYGGNPPENMVTTSYTVSGGVIGGATGKTLSEFEKNYKPVNYKYSYAVYNKDGRLYSNDVIDSSCVLYVYGGDIMFGRYTFE